ncbi:hypothetical protein N9P82_00675 [bacterium]|nr:hypothetical protein [bacterium]
MSCGSRRSAPTALCPTPSKCSMSNRNSWHGGKSTSCATWKMSSPERYRDAWTSICLACRPWCALMRRELS